MKADSHAWWCYASVRAALPDDETVWTVVDVGYLEEMGGVTDGAVTVRCVMKRTFRYPVWRVEGAGKDLYAQSLTELGEIIEQLRAQHQREDVA